jgi:acetylornithine deacetylase/succinyl-diaminopimelate desuccinylase-like protein
MTQIQINRESLLTLLQKLIQIDSLNPSLSSKGTGEAIIARYIGAYLNKLGLAGFMLKATSTEDRKQFNPQITQVYKRIHTQL